MVITHQKEEYIRFVKVFEHENETDCCFRSWGLAERNKYLTTTRSLVAVKEEFTSFKRLQVVQNCSQISFLGVSNKLHISVIQTFCQRFACSCKISLNSGLKYFTALHSLLTILLTPFLTY